MAELIQGQGMRFVDKVKYFLEATTYFDIPFTAYEATNHQTTMLNLKNEDKIFDLKGTCKKDQPPLNVLIEAKGYTSDSNLNKHYQDFLYDCFSVWVKTRKSMPNWKARFLFISSHPFYCTRFNELKSINFLRELLSNIQPDESNSYLLTYLDNHNEEVISSFLELVDILFLTPSCDLITIKLKDMVKKILPFWRD